MKTKLILTALAALAATTAQASSSLMVTIDSPVVTATGDFSWLSLDYGLGAAVEDQTGWADLSTPTFAPQELNYDYGTQALVSTAAGNTASASLTETGYRFFVATGNAGGIAVANLDIYGFFSLAPGATVTLQWNRTISGSHSGQVNAPNSYDFVNGMVVNTSGILGGQWTGFDPVYDVVNVNSPAGFAIAGTGPQALSYTNTSDATMVGEFRGSVQVYTRDAVVAIPEPESYGLALAGLLTLGVALRRKR